MVEDAPAGVEAARAAGMRVLGYGEEGSAPTSLHATCASCRHLRSRGEGTGSERGPRPVRSVLAALAANSAIAVTKLIAAAMSGSTAMLAEGIHSVADTGNQACCCSACGRSDEAGRRGAPVRPRQGALLLDVRGRADAVPGRRARVDPARRQRRAATEEELPGLWLGVGVLLAAAVFEGSALRVALRAFNRERGQRSFWGGIRRAKDPETLTVVFEDTAALTGIGARSPASSLAHMIDDAPLGRRGAIVIGVILVGVAVALARESRDLLIGESATPEIRTAIREAIERLDEVDEIRELLTMHVGPEEVLVNVEIAFKDGLDTDGVEEAILRRGGAILERVPEAAKIFVEPRRPSDFGGNAASSSGARRRRISAVASLAVEAGDVGEPDERLDAGRRPEWRRAAAVARRSGRRSAERVLDPGDRAALAERQLIGSPGWLRATGAASPAAPARARALASEALERRARGARSDPSGASASSSDGASSSG